MRLINLKSLRVGEQLSNTIRAQDGRVLLASKTTVTDNHIKRLSSFGIANVYIEDELFDDVSVKPSLSDETKMIAFGAVATAFQQISSKKDVDSGKIKTATKNIVSDIRKSLNDEPIGLFNTYAVNDPRCLHAVNVASIVAAIALEHEYPFSAIEEFTQAALLHDIMLDSINNDYSDKTHPAQTMEKLKMSHAFNPRTYITIMQHHEKYDGTGFPNKVKGDVITDGARILAVADMYDNLVYGYGYDKQSYNYAVEHLNSEAGKTLDPMYLRHFNESIAIYPTGATVVLNNGFRAIVVGQNPKLPTRPRVRLLMPNREDCILFNMKTHTTLFINSVEL